MTRPDEPSAEAIAVARELEQCDNAERVHCFAWQLQGRPCDKCLRIALALGRFRAAGMREERERCGAIFNQWDAECERYADIPYDLPTLKALLLQHIKHGYEP